MIDLIDVRKVFNQGKPNEFVAIHGMSLSIDTQKVTVLKGPSGCGKTTLLSLIGCMAKSFLSSPLVREGRAFHPTLFPPPSRGLKGGGFPLFFLMLQSTFS